MLWRTQDSAADQLINEYKGLFGAIDVNKTGGITIDDVKAALIAYGFRRSDEEVRQMWADAHCGAEMTFAQFVGMIESTMTGYVTRASLEEAFKVIEANQGRDRLVGGGPGPNDVVGALDADEFERMLLQSGTKMTQEEVDEFYACVKVDANGRIVVDDLVKLLVE